MGTVISADLCTTCTSLQSGDQLCALSVWCQLWQQQQQQLEEGGEGGAWNIFPVILTYAYTFPRSKFILQFENIH